MEIIIAHQTFSDWDAVGHDIIGMYEALKETGHDISIYAENYVDGARAYKTTEIDWNKIISRKDNVLIYHHSIYWEHGEKILKQFKGKKIIRYHNVTPSSFFKPYSNDLANVTQKGRDQTKRFSQQKDLSLFIGDSIFNSNELIEFGANPEKVKIVPPFNKIEEMEMTKADHHVMEQLAKNRNINALFVGQVFPHKGHKHIIRVANRYKQLFGDNVIFWIVGKKYPELNKYMEELNKQINSLNLSRNIRFTNKLPMDTLKSFFISSTIFLCMSEHEGFCIPLIEAQKFRLPIIAYNSTAVKETIGMGQILFNERDYDLFASAIFTVANDESTRGFLIGKGYENYKNRFTADIIKKTFMGVMKCVLEDEQ